MIQQEEYFTERLQELNRSLQDLDQTRYNNPIDFHFDQASVEGEIQGVQSALVQYRRFITESSLEEAAIMMHQYCFDNSTKNRTELGKVEGQENQEDIGVTSRRGTLNGLINAFNDIRLHFDGQTSEHAAARDRTKR